MGNAQHSARTPPLQPRKADVDHLRTILIVGMNRSGKSTLCNGLVNAPLAQSSGNNAGRKNDMSNTVVNTEFLVRRKQKTFRIVDTPDVADVENTLAALCGSWRRTYVSRKERLELCSVFFTTTGSNIGHFLWIAKCLQDMDPEGYVRATILFKNDLPPPSSAQEFKNWEKILRTYKMEKKVEIKTHLGVHGIELKNLRIIPNEILTLGEDSGPRVYNQEFIEKLWHERVPNYEYSYLSETPLSQQLLKFVRRLDLDALSAGENRVNLESFTHYREKSLITSPCKPDNKPIMFSDFDVQYEELLFFIRSGHSPVRQQLDKTAKVPGTKSLYQWVTKSGSLTKRIVYRRIHWVEVDEAFYSQRKYHKQGEEIEYGKMINLSKTNKEDPRIFVHCEVGFAHYEQNEDGAYFHFGPECYGPLPKHFLKDKSFENLDLLKSELESAMAKSAEEQVDKPGILASMGSVSASLLRQKRDSVEDLKAAYQSAQHRNADLRIRLDQMNEGTEEFKTIFGNRKVCLCIEGPLCSLLEQLLPRRPTVNLFLNNCTKMWNNDLFSMHGEQDYPQEAIPLSKDWLSYAKQWNLGLLPGFSSMYDRSEFEKDFYLWSRTDPPLNLKQNEEMEVTPLPHIKLEEESLEVLESSIADDLERLPDITIANAICEKNAEKKKRLEELEKERAEYEKLAEVEEQTKKDGFRELEAEFDERITAMKKEMAENFADVSKVLALHAEIANLEETKKKNMQSAKAGSGTYENYKNYDEIESLKQTLKTYDDTLHNHAKLVHRIDDLNKIIEQKLRPLVENLCKLGAEDKSKPESLKTVTELQALKALQDRLSGYKLQLFDRPYIRKLYEEQKKSKH
jgi:hypothetical protein